MYKGIGLHFLGGYRKGPVKQDNYFSDSGMKGELKLRQVL